MKPLIIKNKTFGEGTPKICIPITGRNEAEIMEAAGRILNLPHDMAEWRSDFFEQVTEPDKVCHILSELRRVLPDSLLLFTFRTHKEGGVRELSDEAYLEICRNVLESRLTDLLDLELFTGEEALLPLISLAHKTEFPLSCPTMISTKLRRRRKSAAASPSWKKSAGISPRLL